MDYETGARLASLRKANGYSQEALAEQLGISRQAVSKWERGESSPDTDNLIQLAALYSMSLDELLGMGAADEPAEDVPIKDDAAEEKPIYVPTEDDVADEKPIYVPTEDYATEEEPVDTPKKKHEKRKREKKIKEHKPALFPGLAGKLMRFPFPFIVAAIYVGLGYYTQLWHPLWLITTLIPVYYWFVLACRAKTKRGFLLGLPVLLLTALIYLTIGLVTGVWLKPLMLFLIVPIYYWLAAAFGKRE